MNNSQVKVFVPAPRSFRRHASIPSSNSPRRWHASIRTPLLIELSISLHAASSALRLTEASSKVSLIAARALLARHRSSPRPFLADSASVDLPRQATRACLIQSRHAMRGLAVPLPAYVLGLEQSMRDAVGLTRARPLGSPDD